MLLYCDEEYEGRDLDFLDVMSVRTRFLDVILVRTRFQLDYIRKRENFVTYN